MAARHDHERRVAIDPAYADFLRQQFEIARDGRVDDLAQHSSTLSDPKRDRADADRFGRWLEEVDHGYLTAAPGQLAEFLDYIDDTNDFERIVAEHEAFAHLFRQFDESAPAQ